MKNPKRRYCYVLKLFPEYYNTKDLTGEVNEILSAHFQYLKKLTESGIVILAGRTIHEPMTENDFGICIFEASAKEEARQIMENDPCIKNKIMYAEFFDFSLALLRKENFKS